MKKQIFIQYVLTVVILFFIVFYWEFYVEYAGSNPELASEHWKYIITVTVFVMLALIIPTVISIKEWSKRQRVQDEVQKMQYELRSAIEQTSSIIDFKILNRNFDSLMENPYLEKCWEKMRCAQKECRCYGKHPMRCWLVSGTLCQGEVQGVFVQKYGNCYRCEVYQDATCSPSIALREHLNNMIHVLERQRQELLEALSEIKTLRGIIPICSYCKKIRNDQGAWDILEAYITEHSDAQFSHGICPECYKKQMEDTE